MGLLKRLSSKITPRMAMTGLGLTSLLGAELAFNEFLDKVYQASTYDSNLNFYNMVFYGAMAGVLAAGSIYSFILAYRMKRR